AMRWTCNVLPMPRTVDPFPVPGSTQWCLAPSACQTEPGTAVRRFVQVLRRAEPGTSRGGWRYVSVMARVAVITGAGTGVGRAAAIALAAHGFAIVLAGRRPEPLEEVAAELGDGH